MSEYDDHERERRKPTEQPPEAKVHTSKWNPWIWMVPVLAVFFVGYLIVRYGFFGGGDVTVRFADARGLDRYSPVRFRGAKVGTVQKITIDDELKQVVVRISMDAAMNHALRAGTRFWIVEPGLEGGGLGGILGGTYVGIAPGEGEETREFVGQEYAPLISAPEAGKTLILEAEGVGGGLVGAPVNFRGMRVGTVLGAEYDEKRRITNVHAFVVERFAHHVRQSTRFWRSGGLNVSLGGGGVSVGGGGIASLLSSPISFYTPDVMPGAPVANGTRFKLYESEGAAVAASDGPHLTYLTYFPGPVRGLMAGTPVQVKGVQVGRVREVRLRYVPQNASLETPVTLEIDPRKMEMPVSDTTTREELRAQMNDALGRLVVKGLRATLQTSLVLPGAGGVSLELVGAPNTARLVTTSDPPIIPAASSGTGIEGALSAVNDVAARIRALPIEEIAGNLRSTASRINTLVHDPALGESVQRLNRALSDVEKVTATARENAGPIVTSLRKAATDMESVAGTAKENVEPIVQSLRNAAASAETAASRATQLLGSAPRQNYDLAELIKELTRAAEAVRALATYLEENPDSLLKGRPKK